MNQKPIVFRRLIPLLEFIATSTVKSDDASLEPLHDVLHGGPAPFLALPRWSLGPIQLLGDLMNGFSILPKTVNELQRGKLPRVRHDPAIEVAKPVVRQGALLAAVRSTASGLSRAFPYLNTGPLKVLANLAFRAAAFARDFPQRPPFPVKISNFGGNSIGLFNEKRLGINRIQTFVQWRSRIANFQPSRRSFAPCYLRKKNLVFLT